MKDIPAFPLEMVYTQENEKFNGMTLRDYFAAKALPVCYQYWMNDFYHPDHRDAEDRNAEGRDDFHPSMQLMAEYAYSLADAMMKARES
jgi:hypothetical protein